MNQASDFQKKYPLSPKKFWKKMIGNIIPLFILSLCLAMTIFTVLVLTLSVTTVTTLMLMGVLSFLGALAILFGIVSLYISAYIRRYYYDANDLLLTIQKGVFAPTEIHVPFAKMQDVYVDQDILDRMMGLYDVHIASATVTSGIEAHIDGVEAEVMEALKNLLLGRVQSVNKPVAMNVQKQNPNPGPALNSTNYPISLRWIFTTIVTNAWASLILAFPISIALEAGKQQEGAPPHFVYFLPILILVFFLFWIPNLLWRYTFYFEFGPEFLLMRTGVLSREEKHVPYHTIQNVSVSSRLTERLLGICTVSIENATMGSMSGRGGRILIPGQSFDKGKELSDELNRIMQQQNPQQRTGL